MKNIAVVGFSQQIDDSSITAAILHTGVPSLTCSADNKGICKDGFSISLTNITQGAFVSPVAVGSYNATTNVCLADGSKVLREGDTTSTITTVATNPSGATITLNFKVEITNAGQSKVLSN
jgi:hypothetical protein